MENAQVEVVAQYLTPEHVCYECPVCRTKYKKNGEPYKSAKPVIHKHGNEDGTSLNRVIYRSHHAVRDDLKTFKDVCIKVTDQTLKFF